MTSKEITNVLQSAEGGAKKTLDITKININNQTALIVRKVLGNHHGFSEDIVPGRFLTTVPVAGGKHRDVTYHKLVVEGPAGQTVDANDVFTVEMAIRIYNEAVHVATIKRNDLLLKEREAA